RRSVGCWRSSPTWRPWCWPARRWGMRAAPRRTKQSCRRLSTAACASRWRMANARRGTTATKTAGGWRLDGSKSVVVHGDSADKLIVSARVSGDRHDPDGIGLFLVDAKANGVARRSYKMRDGTAAADIALSAVDIPAADALGEPGPGLKTIERVHQAGIMATCAEAVGTMETMLAMTI